MAAAVEFFRPNWLKLVLALTLILPIFTALMFILVVLSGWFHTHVNPLAYLNFNLLVILMCLAGYLAGCLLDFFLKSRPLKIAIAVVAAFVTIVIGYIFLFGRIGVSDPVHRPMVCDPVHTVVRTTPVPAMQTVSTCENNCLDAVQNQTMTELVRQKLGECLQNCSR